MATILDLKDVIVLTGLAGSGKDSTADHMIARLKDCGITAIKLGLADRVKVISRHLIKIFYGIDIPLQDFYDTIKKEQIHPEYPLFNGKPFKLRSVMQIVGTEIFREYLWGDIWCDYIKRTYMNNDSKYQVIIISDGRFFNELQYFKNMLSFGEVRSCFSYRVSRLDRNALTDGNQNHQSEIHINKLQVDGEIDNNGTMDELHSKIDTIIDHILVRCVPPTFNLEPESVLDG